MIPCAYLRVFQPIEAFPAAEQAHWERYIVEGRHLVSPHPVYRDHSGARHLGVLAPEHADGADVRLVDGVYHVSPWRTRLRVLAAMLSFREVEPFEGAEAFVGRREARRAARELARMRRRNPMAVSFVMQSPWHVPIRWFALFDDEERRLVDDGGRWRLTYETRARKGVRRAEEAIPALRRSELGPLADLLLELHQWLLLFDPRSLVVLDYDGLCGFMTWDEMDDDRSARDVRSALSALSSGEYARSAELYQSVMSRWAEVRGRENLN